MGNNVSSDVKAVCSSLVNQSSAAHLIISSPVNRSCLKLIAQALRLNHTTHRLSFPNELLGESCVLNWAHMLDKFIFLHAALSDTPAGKGNHTLFRLDHNIVLPGSSMNNAPDAKLRMKLQLEMQAIDDALKRNRLEFISTGLGCLQFVCRCSKRRPCVS